MDFRVWSFSETKLVLVGFLIYGLIFFGGPIALAKGWAFILRRDILLPLCIAILSLSMWHLVRGAPIVALVVIVYIHRKIDLSSLGIQSKGVGTDLLAIAFLVSLSLVPCVIWPNPSPLPTTDAFEAGIDRLLFNPASTVENLFYFGFLANRVSKRMNAFLTSITVALLYTLHEATNPEYWYASRSFVMIFIAVFLTCLVYLWRRSVPVVWLSSGISRFLTNLF